METFVFNVFSTSALEKRNTSFLGLLPKIQQFRAPCTTHAINLSNFSF